MTDLYLFPQQPVEVVRILDGDLEECAVQKFTVRIIEEQEHIYAYCAFRPLQTREDGQKFIEIHLESLPDMWIGVDARKLIV